MTNETLRTVPAGLTGQCIIVLQHFENSFFAHLACCLRWQVCVQYMLSAAGAPV